MTVDEALEGVRRVFLDTADAVYIVEINDTFSEVARSIVGCCIDRTIEIVVGPVTIAECLSRSVESDELQALGSLLVESSEFTFRDLGQDASVIAGNLRRQTGLELPDALQIAQTVSVNCDIFLTNDREMSVRQTAAKVVSLSEIDP